MRGLSRIRVNELIDHLGLKKEKTVYWNEKEGGGALNNVMSGMWSHDHGTFLRFRLFTRDLAHPHLVFPHSILPSPFINPETPN